MTVAESADVKGMYVAQAEFSNRPWVMNSSFSLEGVLRYAVETAKAWELNVELTSGVEAQMTVELQNLIPPKIDRPHKVTELPDPNEAPADEEVPPYELGHEFHPELTFGENFGETWEKLQDALHGPGETNNDSSK